MKEATTLLELALWKGKLAGFKVEGDKGFVDGEKKAAKKANIDDDEGARKEARITSGDK